MYNKTVYVTSTAVDSMLIPSYSAAELLFKTFVTFKPLVYLVVTNLRHCVCTSRNLHFDFRSLLISGHILSPFPPTSRDMPRKNWEISSNCHIIIFRKWSDPPENLRVLNFRNLGSRPRNSRPRNLQRARIKNSKWRPISVITQNGCEGTLCPYRSVDCNTKSSIKCAARYSKY